MSGVGLVASPAASGRPCASRSIPQALAAYGLNIDDLRTTIANANVNMPEGQFRRADAQASTINANDQICQPPRLSEPDRRLQQRRAGAAVATSPRS